MLRRQTFDTVADQYARYRPSYPEAVFDKIDSFLGTRDSTRVLEVGPGTGQATGSLVNRGWAVQCVEPGESLADTLSRRFEGDSHVTVQRKLFEAWDGPSHFDLVFAAQSFHHVDSADRFQKAANALTPGGAIALVWNVPVESDSELDRKLRDVYASGAAQVKPSTNAARLALEEEARACGKLFPPESHVFPWSQTYSTSDYIGLLGTFSDHLLLPEDRRLALFEAVGAAIGEHGGQYTLERESYVCLSRRRSNERL